MRKTALGTDRRPAHCFSVQDDDELGQLGMVTKLIFRPQPRQGPPRWGPLPFQRPRQNAPAVTQWRPWIRFGHLAGRA